MSRLILSCSLLLTVLASANVSAMARCACEGDAISRVDALSIAARAAAEAALKLPSESDRRLARDFRSRNLLVDADEWYLSSVRKAGSELTEAHTQLQQSPSTVTAPELEQTAAHSASVAREACTYFQLRGQVLSAAQSWEIALNAETVARRLPRDVAMQYGIVAKLFESSGQVAKASELYRKQLDLIQATSGRYSPDAAFAQKQLARLERLSYTKLH